MFSDKQSNQSKDVRLKNDLNDWNGWNVWN